MLNAYFLDVAQAHWNTKSVFAKDNWDAKWFNRKKAYMGQNPFIEEQYFPIYFLY